MTVSPRHGRRLSRWGAAAACGVLTLLVGTPPAYADATRNRQWHLEALDVTEAHKTTRGSGVVVAVVDSGVRANHPDLSGNVLPGTDVTGAGTNGQRDEDGHGTRMAGLIAGHGHGPGNADGVLGIAPEAKILPIRIMAGGVARGGSVTEGVREAVRRDADVISVSVTAGGSDALQAAVQEAQAADIVVVGGVGNRPNDAFVGFPAALPGVLAVGATGRDGKLAPFSVTGKELVLTAPGVDMLSSSPDGGYLTNSGTSPATAIVAGAVALVRAKFPDLSAAEVVHRMTATATDRGAPGRDPEYGYGALNLVEALTADVKPAAPTSSADAPTPPADESSPAVAAPPNSDGPADLQLSPAAYVLGGLCLLLVLAGGGVLVWLLVRSGRRRRGPPPGQPAVAGHASPGQPSYPPPSAPSSYPSGYPPSGYPPSGGPPAPGYPAPGYGQPGPAGPPTHPGGPPPNG